MTNPATKKISKPLYIYAVSFWAVALLTLPLGFIWDFSGLTTLYILALLVEFGWSGVFRYKRMPEPAGKKDAFTWIVSAVSILAFAGLFVMFAALLQGSPDIVEGAYVRTSHGEVTGTLTQEAWQALTICERQMLFCFCLGFSSNMLSWIHPLYREQQVHEKSGPTAPSART